MAYDEKLVERIRKCIGKNRHVTEKHMFGGLSFLLNGKMFCGIIKNDLVVRVGPGHYEEALKRPHARAMDFTGKPIKGFVYVSPKGCNTEKALRQWIGLGFEYATSLTKKK